MIDPEKRKWNGEYNHRGDKRGCTGTHGMSGTRIYECWTDMKRRCYNTKNKRYQNYGGRGIEVCDEWRNDFRAFHDWAMRHGYTDDLTLDRIDVNDNYHPSNCRWLSRAEQMRNTTKNHYITAFGETKTMTEWSEIYGVHRDVIKDRLNKLHWGAEEAISLPTLPMGGKRKK